LNEKSLSGSRKPERLFYLGVIHKAGRFWENLKGACIMRIREMDIEFYSKYLSTLETGWQYNELKPCGVKYNSLLCALSYDVHHGKFRDYLKESEEIIELLGLDTDQTVIDMGCGTGAFAIHAAEDRA